MTSCIIFINDMFSKSEMVDKEFANKFYARKINSSFFREMLRSIKLYLKDWIK